MSAHSQTPATDSKFQRRFELMLERIHHEDTLMGNRVNWLLTSQTIFFAAFAFQPTGKSVLIIIPLIALITCCLNYLSILGAVLAIYRFCKELDNEFPEYSVYSQSHILGPTFTHVLGQASPIFIPLWFISIWIYAMSNSDIWLPVMLTSFLLFILILLWFKNFPYRRTGTLLKNQAHGVTK